MKSTSEAAFDRIAGMLRQRDYRLRIEGHTDNAPIHTAQFPSNWELSTSRATEIVRLLIVRDGFGPDRLSAAGYAEYHPVASNLTVEGRGMNRRVDIVILGHASAGRFRARPESSPDSAAATPGRDATGCGDNRRRPRHSSPAARENMLAASYSSNSIQSALSMGIEEYGAISRNPILR